VVVLLTNAWWGFFGAILSAMAGLLSFAATGTYKGRLERPARKAAERAAKETRRRRAQERHGQVDRR